MILSNNSIHVSVFTRDSLYSRRKKEEGRRKKEEGRGKREEGKVLLHRTYAETLYIERANAITPYRWWFDSQFA
ncbi:hypothetical protein [Okeania sp. KiyG1]|uniref:hypothetical protein n=1 Tax=Okeania sp. KiyG1 TaxID=2720165 RepID=UPI001922760E|nr:hypothetical protein [Okeania sp. KiyG1]